MFKAGAIQGDAILNTDQWDAGVKKVDSTSKKLTNILGTLAKVGITAVAAALAVFITFSAAAAAAAVVSVPPDAANTAVSNASTRRAN